ncbi:MAG TPA: hypothetical protein DCL41_01630, partial [Bdellovibrionales bacterium]|nr:hypothetical protein [Bdellovibrionales bacterium]
RSAKSLNKKFHMPLKVSVQNIDYRFGDPFQLFEVTVENTSDEWVRINKSEVIINNPAQSKMSVVTGNDLVDWAQAMNSRKNKENHNRQMRDIGIITLGTIAAGGSNSSDPIISAVGDSSMIGTTAWAVDEVIRKSLEKAEQSEKTPQNHLYRPFAVPGKMYVRKWVLLNKPSKNRINKLVLELESVEGEKEKYEISM